MPGIYRPAPPAPQRPAVDGPPIGSVKSPIPDLKLPGSQTVSAGGMRIGSFSVPQLRSFLIHKGYDIPEEGGLGPRMKAALADFLNPKQTGGALAAALGKTRITGKRNPDAWNKLFGSAASRPKVLRPVTGPNGLVDANGNTAPDLSDPAGTVDVSGISGLAPNVGTTVSPGLADKMAGLQYDSSITDARTALARQPVQASQDLHDIENWYGQVLGAQKVAAGRDTDMTTAGVGSIRDAVSRIVSSLGGSANEGSGLVGAAGADQVGTLQALGTTQDQYNSDIAPLLRSESAGARQQQMAVNTRDNQDATSAVQKLVQARGQAKAAAGLDISKYNNDVNQQEFQNELALEQAKEAAALTGAKIIGAVKNGKLPKGAYANTSGSQKISIANGITSSLTDENGNLKAGWTPQRAVSFINSQLQSAGWDLKNPSVQQYRAALLKTVGLV